MPGLFPNPSAAPEAFQPGDQVRWYVGDAHISPYVGVVTQVQPGIQKVDVEFPVGGNQRMSPEDLILVTRFVGEAPLKGDTGYSSYDKARSLDGYGTFKQNLREMAKVVVSKKASQDGKPMATVIAERFASEVVDELASDVCDCANKGMTDITAYQRIYPKYASKCSDAFLRGAVKRVYAAQGAQRWTTSNTELDQWSERDRNSVILKDKASGKSIMEWWDEAVHDAVEDGFLTMGKGKDRLHQDAVDYANERGLKPQSSDKWHKSFQEAEKYHQEEHDRSEADSFMFDVASKVGIKNPKVDVNTQINKASIAVGGLSKDVIEKLLAALEDADVDAKEESIPIWVDNSKQINKVVSTGIDDIVYRRSKQSSSKDSAVKECLICGKPVLDKDPEVQLCKACGDERKEEAEKGARPIDERVP